MMDAQHISPDDLALYALQALSPEEMAAVRAHVSGCDVCRAELARAEGDLAMLALSVDQQPLPAGARERFVQRIKSESKAGAVENRRAEPIAIDRAPRSRSTGWIGWLAAAAALIVAAALGFEVSSLKARLQESESRMAALQTSESREKQVAEVLTAPAAQKVVLTAPKTPPAPTGRVVYLAARGGLILQASNLAPVPAGKAYELWVIPADGSAPIPAGVFKPDLAGNGSVVLPEIPQGVQAKAFGVTLEDAAGSKTPTAPILLAGAVQASGE
ncbi:anti-sigma factor [Occallatibacter savannae]|uniref:anti-sigma factor n=1 Tax=Occallatibacter savannae TaxID=1002691 RepID=UPI000D68A65A|nr:anti-sigma factor [Occallatibacter savannae]